MTTSSTIFPDEAAQAARQVRTTVRTRQLLVAAARLMERDGSEAVSMQALAQEASVSVGLIYRYFGNKQDLLLAVIVQVLDSLAERVPAAIARAGADPVERIAAGFGAYCNVIDEHRHAAVLTYRESKSLGPQGRERIKQLEIETFEPLRHAVADGVESGHLAQVDPDLFAYDLLLLAHSWALKHWYFQNKLDLDAYVRKQTALMLRSALTPQHRSAYQHLLERS